MSDTQNNVALVVALRNLADALDFLTNHEDDHRRSDDPQRITDAVGSLIAASTALEILAADCSPDVRARVEQSAIPRLLT